MANIIWTFGWGVITERGARGPDKKRRLALLLAEHGYLPDEEIAGLAGYSRDGVIRARKWTDAKVDPLLAAA